MLEIWCAILEDFKTFCLKEEGNATESTQGTAAGVIKGLTCIHERLTDALNEVASLNLATEFAEPYVAGLKEALLKTSKY